MQVTNDDVRIKHSWLFAYWMAFIDCCKMLRYFAQLYRCDWGWTVDIIPPSQQVNHLDAMMAEVDDAVSDT